MRETLRGREDISTEERTKKTSSNDGITLCRQVFNERPRSDSHNPRVNSGVTFSLFLSFERHRKEKLYPRAQSANPSVRHSQTRSINQRESGIEKEGNERKYIEREREEGCDGEIAANGSARRRGRDFDPEISKVFPRAVPCYSKKMR